MFEGFGSNSEFETALMEANDILQDLHSKTPSFNFEEIEQTQLHRANKCHSEMQSFKNPLDQQDFLLADLKKQIAELDERVEDLNNYTNNSQQQAFEIDKKNKKNR